MMFRKGSVRRDFGRMMARIIVLFGLCILSVSCRSSPEVETAVPTGTFIPATESFSTVTASPLPVSPTLAAIPVSPTPSPTATVAPTATPTPLPTATEEPQLLEARVIRDVTEIRDGPGDVYDVIGYYTKGVDLPVLGRNAGSDWLLVDLGLDQSGWISLDNLSIDFDHLMVPIVEAPPLPTVPPAYMLAWIAPSSDGSGINLNVQLYNFNRNEVVEITVTRSNNGIVDAKRTTTYVVDKENLVRFGLYTSSSRIIPGMTYVITAVGDQGTTLQTTIFIPEKP